LTPKKKQKDYREKISVERTLDDYTISEGIDCDVEIKEVVT